MNEHNLVTLRRSTRCSACKLPEEVLGALHQDRFESGMGFEKLALKYSEHRPLSEAGVRRHFSRHVPEPEDSPISESGGAPGADPAACGTEHGDELDGHAVLEASTKALTEMMASLVREYRAAVGRNAREAERILGVFMKVQGQLQRSLKARDESRALRDEFLKHVPQVVDRITSAAMHPILGLMRKNAERVREDVVEYSHGRLSPEDFSARLLLLEREWPKEVGVRLRAATTEALKVEEAKVQG